ncbi:Protein of uncharacterised function (DUF2618) [Salmonella enterica subsp. enterica serovar Typhi]|nr:Protein of uncharacterised function (DUF2618) [Salmonella enterica subsp. enterica serovar Typhi]CHH21952.1 Protein of uncharacterised function (DUF2618) [Salmonella enterica subsp. enterica serovar Typhi]CRF61517.1 Protein of uncharacterised function (DUF2618) [Salmonella enterica subsp. enterica serovar Typhi]
MENNNRFMPHIRQTTHIMMFAHRNSFDFHFFNARYFFCYGYFSIQVFPTLMSFRSIA